MYSFFIDCQSLLKKFPKHSTQVPPNDFQGDHNLLTPSLTEFNEIIHTSFIKISIYNRCYLYNAYQQIKDLSLNH